MDKNLTRGSKILIMGLVLCSCMIVSGCAITHDFKQASGIKDAEEISIIKSSETKEGFLDAIIGWLEKNSYKYVILPEGTSLDGKNWALTYTVRWSWDVTIYLSKAAINAYKHGVQVGNATYSVQGNNSSLNLSKWRNAEETIKKMMSNLFFGKPE